ncbi:unnamed protein product, partial [Vitis vinifera]
MNEDKHCRSILFHTTGPNTGDQEPFSMGSNIQSRPSKLLSRALTVRPYINYKNHTISIQVFIFLNFLVSFNLQFNSIRSSPLFFIYFLRFSILSVKPKKLLISIMEVFLGWQGSFLGPERKLHLYPSHHMQG